MADNFKQITATTYGRSSYTYNITKGNETISYLYDGADQRFFKKVVTPAQTTEEMYVKDALGHDLAIVKFTTTGGATVAATEYFVFGADRIARVTNQAGGTAGRIYQHEATYFLQDHLGNTRVSFAYSGNASTPLTVVNAMEELVQTNEDDMTTSVSAKVRRNPYGKILREFDNGDGDRYLTTQHERDKETGLDYRGARYYDSDVARFLSTDPWADKYPAWSTYNYCMGNPIIFTDPTGKGVTGDYYTSSGKWLGSDGNKDDDKAYVADSKNEDGTFKNAKELSIGNTELLDRATWVHGESGGSAEKITERIQNAGNASKTSDARVVDYYAHAINNGAIKSGGFYKGIKTYMKKKINGITQYTGEGYFTGDGIGGNGNSKKFANAREVSMTELMKVTGAKNSISAVIGSVNGGDDPTGGCRVWLGADDAKKYVNNPNMKTPNAGFQFSFSSKDGAFNHSFWRK